MVLAVGCAKKKTVDPGWSGVGGGAVPGASSGAIAVGTDHTVYAAFLGATGLTVMKAQGSTWVDVGTPVAVFPASITLAVDGTTPYVAYTDYSDNATVMKFNGTTWVNVGNAAFATTYWSWGSTLSLAFISGVPYVGFEDSTYALRVMTPSGGTWGNVGTLTATVANMSSLATLNGVLYVAHDGGGEIAVDKYNGTTWQNVATFADTVDEMWGQNLLVSNGTIYVCYKSSNYGAVFLKLNGTTLQSVGTLGTISNGDYVEYISGAVYNGTPYVAFDDEDTLNSATVKVFSGSSWQLYAGYPSQADIEDTLLTVDPADGHLYLTYSDGDTGMMVQVH
jgi:hypothetical protein